ncbi:MAG: plasmid mobilization protein [Ruminococcus sp.]
MKRNCDTHIRLTKEERDDWQRKAEMTCLNESALVRLLMKGYEPKEKPDDRFFEAMRELSAIGSNINQLAAKANSLGFVDAPMLYREAERWHKFQADIEATFLRPDKSNLKWK